MNDSSHQPSDQQEKKGLECPRCGCRHLPVLYTRQLADHILRIRRCRYCGRRVRTRERSS